MNSFLKSTWPFGQNLYVLIETTKAPMCLKYVLFPVLTWQNLAFKDFHVLFFSPKALCAFFNSKRFVCLLTCAYKRSVI